MDDSPELATTTEQKKPGPISPAKLNQRRAEGKALLLNRPLSRSEEAFCRLVAMGWPLWRCYQDATGHRGAKSTAEVQSWRWRLRPAVAAEIARQRSLLTDAGTATRAERRHILGSIMRDPDAPQTARIQAIIVDNRMTGEDEPQRAAGQSAVVVFTVDPIGEGTRGLRQAEEQKVLATSDSTPPRDSTIDSTLARSDSTPPLPSDSTPGSDSTHEAKALPAPPAST